MGATINKGITALERTAANAIGGWNIIYWPNTRPRFCTVLLYRHQYSFQRQCIFYQNQQRETTTLRPPPPHTPTQSHHYFQVRLGFWWFSFKRTRRVGTVISISYIQWLRVYQPAYSVRSPLARKQNAIQMAFCLCVDGARWNIHFSPHHNNTQTNHRSSRLSYCLGLKLNNRAPSVYLYSFIYLETGWIRQVSEIYHL